MEKIRFGTILYTGEDSLERLTEFKDEKIFIVTDPFIDKSGILEKVRSYITSSVETKVFSEVVPDPPIDTIILGISEAESFNPTIIIALGGGSAIDAAKGILYFGKQSKKINNIPFVVIPTTSGSGSEVTNFAIITDAEKKAKYPLIADDILPNEAILDASLVTGLPPVQTADTGIDVLTHAIEAYVSTKSNDISDALAEKSIVYVFEYLERAYKYPDDLISRNKMHIASCMAGLAFNQASLGINHSIAHAAGARFHIAHGRLNGILLPHVIRYNSGMGIDGNKPLDTARKYTKLAKILGLNANSPRMGVRSMVNAIVSLEKRLNMPTSLSEWGLNKDDFKLQKSIIAEDSLTDRCTKTNPVKVNKEDIESILDKAY